MIGSLLSALGLAAAKAEARAAARRIGIQAAVAGVTALLILTAVGLALAALTVWLAGELGTIAALLIVAGGLIVLAAIVLLVARLTSTANSRRRPAGYSSTFANVPPPPPRPGDEPPPGSAMTSVAIVALVGFILARQLMRK